MGFDIESFTTPPDEEFICAICLDVMKDPLMSEGCEHIFCKECVDHCDGRCPLDRNEIGRLRPPHRSFANTLGRLQIRCQFSNFDVDGAVGPGGCTHIGNLADIRQHEEGCPHKNKTKTKTKFFPASAKPKSKSKIRLWPPWNKNKNKNKTNGFNCSDSTPTTAETNTERYVCWKQQLKVKDDEIKRLTTEIESNAGTSAQRDLVKRTKDELEKKNTEIKRLGSELASSASYAEEFLRDHVNLLQAKDGELKGANAEIWRLTSLLGSSAEASRKFRQEQLELLERLKTKGDEMAEKNKELAEKDAEIKGFIEAARLDQIIWLKTKNDELKALQWLKEAKDEILRPTLKLESFEAAAATEVEVKLEREQEQKEFQFPKEKEQEPTVESQPTTSKVKPAQSGKSSEPAVDELEPKERSEVESISTLNYIWDLLGASWSRSPSPSQSSH